MRHKALQARRELLLPVLDQVEAPGQTLFEVRWNRRLKPAVSHNAHHTDDHETTS
jgi:hypothetical protein